MALLHSNALVAGCNGIDVQANLLVLPEQVVLRRTLPVHVSSIHAKWLGRVLWKGGDGAIIDGIGPNGIAARVMDVTGRVVKMQTGFVYHYAFVMMIGVAIIITYFMYTSGGFGQ